MKIEIQIRIEGNYWGRFDAEIRILLSPLEPDLGNASAGK